MKKIKNSQPQTKFTGSYKKKNVFQNPRIRKVFAIVMSEICKNGDAKKSKFQKIP